MRLFRFEKWFIDILTQENDYIIISHTVTSVIGFRVCYIEVNLGTYASERTQDGFQLNRKLKILRRENNTLWAGEGSIMIVPGHRTGWGDSGSWC